MSQHKDPSHPEYWGGVKLVWSDHAYEQSIRRGILAMNELNPSVMRLADCGHTDDLGFKYVFKICCEEPFHIVLSQKHVVITVFKAGQGGGSHYRAMTEKSRR